MGMAVNAVEVYIVDLNNTQLYWTMDLDNEIYTNLNPNRRLFASAKTISDVVDRIGKGFVESWWDESDGEEPIDFIKNYCEEFGCEDEYESMKEQVRKFEFSELTKIVLLANNESDGCRNYEAVVYDCETKIAKYNKADATWGTNYYRNPRDCSPSPLEFIKSLL